MLAAAAANVDAKFGLQWSEATLERTNHTGGDAGRMPVHSHNRAEGLEPERMGQAAQEFIASVVVDNGLADDRAQLRHALPKPRRHTTTVEGKIGTACASGHCFLWAI